MPQPITIPRLGWSMEQGVFAGWLKSNGDPIRPGELLYTLEGEKAIQEIEAVDSGTLCIPKNAPQVGDTVLVGATIGYVLSDGESPLLELPKRVAPPTVTASPAMAEQPPRSHENRAIAPSRSVSNDPPASPAVRRLARELGVSLADWKISGRVSESDVRQRARSGVTAGESFQGNVPRRQRGLPAVSPRAARVAAELGVDWTSLRGTSSSHRIREVDVLRVADKSAIRRPATTVESADSLPGRFVAAPALRRTIAERLAHGWQQVVPVTLTCVADASPLVKRRQAWKAEGREIVPTVTDLIVQAVAVSLAQHPLLKSRWRNSGWDIPDVTNIGIAVDTPDGLLVPVIRDADKLTLDELARRLRDLAERARTRRLKPDELRGGVFTVTNLGAFGIDAFTPVLNFPESAILGVGAIRREPIVSDDDRLTIADRITLSLTFDHRALDGAPAARFLETLRAAFQQII